MDKSITLNLQVKEINLREGIQSLGISEYPINVTLNHKIGHIKDLIWKKSNDYSLKPIFLKLAYNDRILYDNEVLHEVLNVSESPMEGDSLYNSLELIIDYALYGNRAIPIMEPNDELFDIVINANINHNHSKLTLRESLNCTLNVIKDYYIEFANKHGEESINRNNVKIELQINEEEKSVFDEDDANLLDILKLDVPPLKTVIFFASLKPIINGEVFHNRQYKRFHIKVESDVRSLQEESNLFEVNRATTLHDFKHQLIERIDYLSVTRTFFDQIELYYQTQLIPNTNESNRKTLFELLVLNDSILHQNNGIIIMHLNISNKYGGGRVLSQEFWRDLMSEDRFEFLPNSENDLQNSNAVNHVNELHQNEQPSTANTQRASINNFTTRNQNAVEDNDNQDVNNQATEQQMVLVRPTKLFLRDGTEWNLTGESYELLSLNENSANPTSGSRALLLNQSDLSPIHYEFKADIDGESRKTILNTSQCIIVDNATHRPYILINQAGTAQLDSSFKRNNGNSVLQQLYVELYNHQATPPYSTTRENRGQNAPAQDGVRHNEINRIIDLVRNNFLWGFNIVMRSLVLIYILGLYQPLLIFWRQIFIFLSILLVASIFIFAGEHVGDALIQIFLHGNERPDRLSQRIVLSTAIFLRFIGRGTNRTITAIRSKLISFSVHRSRDYQLLLERRTNLYVLRNSLTNFHKDVILLLLAVVPSLHPYIHQEIENWQNSEISDLREEVNKMYKFVLGRILKYNIKHDDPFTIPSSDHFHELETKFNSPAENNWGTEYKDLIEFYKVLKETNNKLN